jgi:hypothetical protein
MMESQAVRRSNIQIRIQKQSISRLVALTVVLKFPERLDSDKFKAIF